MEVRVPFEIGYKTVYDREFLRRTVVRKSVTRFRHATTLRILISRRRGGKSTCAIKVKCRRIEIGSAVGCGGISRSDGMSGVREGRGGERNKI